MTQILNETNEMMKFFDISKNVTLCIHVLINFRPKI